VEIMAGEILVKFKEGTSEEEIKLFEQKFKLTEFGSDPTIQVYFYRVPEDDITQKVSEITQVSIIKYAQPNYVKKKNGTPNDPYYSQQWHLPHIGMPSAWDEFTGTQVIKVAVLDSGVNKAQIDLVSVIDSVWEYDFDNYDNNADDLEGHGTFVSGIIAATANNGVGIAGISPKVRIVPLKADVANTTSVLSAMTRAYESSSKILNCSYGGYVYEPTEDEKISWLNARGILVVCSAGNETNNNDIAHHYPSDYNLPNIISVASSTSSSVLSSFSNYGVTTVDIAAPGSDILSCIGVGEEFRKTIASWGFNTDFDGWVQSNVNGYGFYWEWSKLGLFSGYNYSGQYSVYSNVSLQSPIIDCRNYMQTEILTMGDGSLGAGDYLGIYSGTSTLASSSRSALLTGNITADYTHQTTAIDQALGRIWYYFTSDSLYNGYFGILYAKLTGIPIYGTSQGTSFAAPVVAGVAAMLMSQNPQLTHLQVKDIILQTARKVSALNGKVVSGGIVDAAAALREAKARIVVAPVVSSVATASGRIGTAFSYQITATGGATSYSATGLPAGLTINTATGLISGTPTAAATSAVTLRATNTAGTGTKTLTITVTVR
jgi:hypothetical protein